MSEAALRPSRAVVLSLWVPPLSMGLAAGASVLMFAAALYRFASLNSEAYDLAYFDQVVWNAAQGHGFVSSFNPYPFFGQHFSPALALFVPPYLLRPSPLWLLAGQSLALGLAVLPLMALASRWIGPRLRLVAAVAYLLQVFVARAVEFDFHTEALAVPFVFWAVLCADQGRPWGLLLAGSVPMLCKEDGALVSLGIGLVALAVFRRRSGLALMSLALAYAAVVTLWVMPALRGGAPSDIVLRYGYLGTGVAGIATGLIAHPGAVAAHLLAPDALLATGLALAGLAFLPLFRPVALLGALPSLLLSLLSDQVSQHQLLYQYGIQPGSLLVVAALLGWQRLGGRPDIAWLLPAAAGLVLVAAGPRPQTGGLERRADAAAVIAHVPQGAPVEASRNLLALLAERSDIAQYPALREEWLVLDGQRDRPADLPGRGYVMVAHSGDFSLWRKGATSSAQAPAGAASRPE